MKTNKKNVATQRRLMDKKLQSWIDIRGEKRPPSGWLKAIRGALGLSTRQLAAIVGIDFSSIIRLEERELQGTVSLEVLDKAAKAMGCKVVYAIVPEDPYQSLESIIDERAKRAATELLEKVEHSMRLEEQGSPDAKAEIERLAIELKTKVDSRIWDIKKPATKKRGKA
jgi:predicted DNA-binding mobile mystery protein A